MTKDKLQQLLNNIDLASLPTQAKLCLEPVFKLGQLLQNQHPLKQVVFFGSLKAGKSTLINALLHNEYLPSRVNRATGVITKITYGLQPTATVSKYNANNTLSQHNINLEDIASHILLDISNPLATAPENIESVTITLPIPLLQPQSGEGSQESGVRSQESGVRSQESGVRSQDSRGRRQELEYINQQSAVGGQRSAVVLVDTPGLSDNASLTAQTYQALAEADLAIMVLNANKILSLVEKEAAIKINTLLNGNLVFIINRLDQIEEDDREEIINWATYLLEDMGNSLLGTPKLFATQAKPSLDARKSASKNAPIPNDNLLPFETWLKNTFNTSLGEEIAHRSRLGRFKQSLQTAKQHLQTQLYQLQQIHQTYQSQTEEAHQQTLAQFQLDSQQLKVKLKEIETNLSQQTQDFAVNCLQHTRTLIRTDNKWADEKKLKACVDKALQTYNHNLNAQLKQALQQCTLTWPITPTFSFTTDTIKANFTIQEYTRSKLWPLFGTVVGVIGGGLPGLFIGASMGDWLSNKLFSKNKTEYTLSLITTMAHQLQPLLSSKTKAYLNTLNNQINQFQQNYQTERNLSLQATQQIQTQYLELIKWCDLMLEEI